MNRQEWQQRNLDPGAHTWVERDSEFFNTIRPCTDIQAAALHGIHSLAVATRAGRCLSTAPLPAGATWIFTATTFTTSATVIRA
jgi:hypothetical protein